MTENAQLFDSFAEEYDEAVSIERKHDFFLDNLPPERDAVLDVGCGTGLLSGELSHHFHSVVALDISAPMLAVARKKRSAPNIDYRLCDANHFSSETRFDAIVSHTTFHHFPELSATLAKLKSLLAPQGRLIVVDCIARFPAAIPRWSISYRVYAALQFLPDHFQRGAGPARTLLRFRTNRAWIEHRKSDRYLSASQFQEVYASCLPGARFTRMKTFTGAIWTAPKKEKTESPNQPSMPTPQSDVTRP